MSHILDNMIWNAIDTGNQDIAIRKGEVGMYRTDIAPFAGLKEWNQQNMDAFYSFVPNDLRVFIHYLDKNPLDEKNWSILRKMDCCQMVYEYPVDNFKTRHSDLIVPLKDKHIAEMIELTALTKPGPFFQRTIDFGHYYGIFIDGRLAAMAGQRMHPQPYMEISAVCTHPDFRGHGYAKAVMLHVMEIILDRSFVPFLHVLTSNTTAIRLYETIGFRIRKELGIDIVSKKS